MGTCVVKLEDLIVFLETENLSTDAMCSFDVIEHIYDMEGFLKECKDIPGKNLRLILGSGANERNPIIKRVLQKGHYSFENTDRPNVFGHKQRDSLLSFLKIRWDILLAYNPKLDIESIKTLALGTRGLRKEDILACVDDFEKTGKLNYVPNHPTNTCDPLSGNWNEQLMDPLWLKSILETQGFAVRVLPGFWGDGVVLYKTGFKIMLNMMIKYSGAFALTFAPYYVIYADRNDHQNKL